MRTPSAARHRRHRSIAMPPHPRRVRRVVMLATIFLATLLLSLGAGPAEARCSKRVYVYSADWCGTCRRLRDYLDLSGISYTLLDADNPRVKADMRARFRSVTVPHMLIGRHAIRGLDTQKIRHHCR